ncbi:putative aminopeptidase [Leishmania braziliensis MHOM/BR/75/M2904]|uniref:Aminopeptidase n=1 Tax=Leishmania braziliensis TaxID=5660 RepID=A4H6I7_LEIBR|nr:putative aminopeptidase [Leishmania braziliensis MHOM/BR/75/M2904]CAM41940.1 putative aminopeptidase [Leishmania braziliensis MHOM/BR/75/M2904]
MSEMKRLRSESAVEESAVSAYVQTCAKFKSNVMFTDISKVSCVAAHVLLVGALGQLRDKSVESLRFYCPAVAEALRRVKDGATVKTLAVVAGREGYTEVTVTALPATASRTSCPYRADSLSEAVVAACGTVDEGETLDVYVRAPAGAEAAIANAVARALSHSNRVACVTRFHLCEFLFFLVSLLSRDEVFAG